MSTCDPEEDAPKYCLSDHMTIMVESDDFKRLSHLCTMYPYKLGDVHRAWEMSMMKGDHASAKLIEYLACDSSDDSEGECEYDDADDEADEDTDDEAADENEEDYDDFNKQMLPIKEETSDKMKNILAVASDDKCGDAAAADDEADDDDADDDGFFPLI